MQWLDNLVLPQCTVSLCPHRKFENLKDAVQTDSNKNSCFQVTAKVVRKADKIYKNIQASTSWQKERFRKVQKNKVVYIIFLVLYGGFSEKLGQMKRKCSLMNVNNSKILSIVKEYTELFWHVFTDSQIINVKWIKNRQEPQETKHVYMFLWFF